MRQEQQLRKLRATETEMSEAKVSEKRLAEQQESKWHKKESERENWRNLKWSENGNGQRYKGKVEATVQL